MIEYLYNAVKATAEQDITLTAILTDAENNPIETNCAIILYDDKNILGTFSGDYVSSGLWNFTIPAAATSGLSGRYWYCICEDNNNLCFKQPLYLV